MISIAARFTTICLGVILFLSASTQRVHAQESDGLKLVHPGTDSVYFAYRNKPLLSFGTMSDFIFYAAEDAFDYRKWADWQAKHGMNHCRAYLPGSWTHIEQFAKENGGSVDNVLFPFEETKPGSRQFDLTKFNEAYWKRFREQCQYLAEKGIIIDLLMWNGWQLWAPYKQAENWDGHFFNPRNNVNAFTDHLGTEKDLSNRLKLYHAVADKKKKLLAAQRAYFEKIIEVTYDLDNIYYELVHELGMNYSHWDKTSQWLADMARTVRSKWSEYNPDRPIILATDGGHLKGHPFNQSGGRPKPGSEMDWVYSRDYFDVMVYGNQHHMGNIRDWRFIYRKPYVAQESRDDSGHSWSFRVPEEHGHIRKYVWKLMMVKCQQIDIYPKGSMRDAVHADRPGYTHNYDPNGWSPFEDDARRLRTFFNSLIDYGALKFEGHFYIPPLGHNLVLSSNKEIVVYMSSPTTMENVEYNHGKGGVQIRLTELPFADGEYQVHRFDPKSGFTGSQKIRIRGGDCNFRIPAFVDDMALHIVHAN